MGLPVIDMDGGRVGLPVFPSSRPFWAALVSSQRRLALKQPSIMSTWREGVIRAQYECKWNLKITRYSRIAPRDNTLWDGGTW